MDQLKDYLLPTPKALKYFNSPIDPKCVIPREFTATNYFVDKHMDQLRDEFDLPKTEELEKKMRRFKFYQKVNFFVLMFHALHWVVLLLIDFDQDTKLKLGDITFLAGGLPTFNLIAFSSFFLMGALVYKTFNMTSNNANANKYVWRYLFDVLRGIRPPADIGLSKK